MDGRPNRRNKTACSNFSGVMWKGLQMIHGLALLIWGPVVVLNGV